MQKTIFNQLKQTKMNTQINNNELVIEMTISHNEVNENFSVMSNPSKMKVALKKMDVWNEIKEFNPNIVYQWAQQVWDITHPNTFGKVTNVNILN